MEMIKNRYKNVNFCQVCGNKLEIQKDREGKSRPKCSTCGWVFYKNPVPAVACVVFNEEKELLIIKRKFEPKPNCWALPSGYIEIYQHPTQAAQDELQEETGLIGEIESFLDYYDGFSPIYEKVLSLGFLMRRTGGQLQAGDDALEARYVALDDLPEIAFKAHRYFIDLAIKKIYKRG